MSSVGKVQSEVKREVEHVVNWRAGVRMFTIYILAASGNLACQREGELTVH